MSLNGVPTVPPHSLPPPGMMMHDVMNDQNRTMGGGGGGGGGVPHHAMFSQQPPPPPPQASSHPMMNPMLNLPPIPQPPGGVPSNFQPVGPPPPPPQMSSNSVNGVAGPSGGSLPPPSSRPTSADACHSIVHSLMCHRQGGEPESFSKRAIESLVKKLKEKRDELDSLIMAITTNGNQATKCVTIQRTLDGRLQVAGRKGFPHVIYARIWRWPDLHKNELKHIKTCQYAFELKCDFVCVNPFHYERMIPAGIDLSSLSLTSHDEDLPGGSHGMSNDHYMLPRPSSPNVVAHYPHDPEKMAFPGGVHPYNPDGLNMNDCSRPPPDFSQNLSIKTEFGTDQQQQQQQQQRLNSIKTSPSTNPNSELHSQDPKWADSMNAYDQKSRSKDPNLNQTETWNSQAASSSSAAAGGSGSGGLVNRSTNGTSSISRPLSNQPLPEFCCSISYFEHDQQSGGTFKVPSSFQSVTIDGYVDPSFGNRFCLGALGNVHRSENSEKTRLHIGKGIKLDFRGEGDVWLNCLSEHSVFLQSYYLDREAGRAPGDAIHKIYPQTYIKVFDLKQCYRQMQQQASDAHNNARSHAFASSGTALGAYPNKSSGMAVDDLGRLCILKLSFVKGWGPDYPRKTIKATPCWVEITLHRAMQLLDEVLHNFPSHESD